MQKTSAKLPKKQTTEEKLAVFGLIQDGHAVKLDDIDERTQACEKDYEIINERVIRLQSASVPTAMYKARLEVVEANLAKVDNPYIALAAEQSRLRLQTVEVSYAYLLERVAYLELPWWRRLFAPLPLVQEEVSE